MNDGACLPLALEDDKLGRGERESEAIGYGRTEKA
ncbi:hypothetical protein M2350_003324 [Candidatus Fervidibacter sacchari]|uniref:Uncharacterized protein n=1 Tax=Candidatus Fervidibacter sacchari TaxID=1448929 RepID=A0ABT2ESE3_9BACT|nr:hypothetical protein [Candidatus Fervidibacter sacchari]